MKIGIDLRMAGGGSGIDRYITELTQQILTQDKTNSYILFFLDEKNAEKYRHFGHKCIVTNIRHYSLAEQVKLPAILNKEKLDLMHFPHFNLPVFYTKPFVVTIHDLTHTLFPGKKKSHFFHRLAYHLVLNSAIRHSQKIIAVSESTKKQIVDRFGVVADKIIVVYEGYNQAYKMIHKAEAFVQVSQKFGITKPYILYVGVWRRYKNLPMLAKSFDKLKDQGLDYELVLAGEPDKFYPEIEKEVLSIKYKADLKALGRLSDEDLNLLYNGATLFVLPSLMEGFGLTALEAAATGTPIACSDIPTLREVLGLAAAYFDPNNLDNMTDVLSGLLKKPKRLQEVGNLALQRATFFSWQKAAAETIKLYQSI